ncbi:hypothetical protein Ade02nite_60460 [Paractinoplanes deccanensis]|uniref:Uncharacterized protein n=1 Tax=Paractinoplanes deccanensis TaxID=113561 RepID=A0ABQ3YBM9_9ACTN|nr:hypothetical protein [Actinoplanes deccanensis]GID77405.1 hypothetical protein Ade02nite_60460 [Actinoplanes deccanensis]
MSGALTRPLVVAVAHLPILIISFCATPLWLMSFLKPATHGEVAFRLVGELRSWSRDVVDSAGGRPVR